MLIALDDDKTWPQPIVEKILSSPQPLKDRDLLVQILEEALPHDIIAFHATRLHKVHIDQLKSGTRPLAPLSPEDEVARVNDVLCHGDLSQSEADALLATTRANEPCRKGLLGLFFTDKIFETDTCYCFFRYWGGESLGQHYGPHKEILRRIGIPCLVKVSVPIKFIREISAEDFVNAYTQNHEGRHIDKGMYGYVKKPECPVTVLDLIEFGSELFRVMTSKAIWPEQIYP